MHEVGLNFNMQIFLESEIIFEDYCTRCKWVEIHEVIRKIYSGLISILFSRNERNDDKESDRMTIINTKLCENWQIWCNILCMPDAKFESSARIKLSR